MSLADSFPIIPPITEVPDYVWAPRYSRCSWLPGRPSKQPKDTSRYIPHPDAESALKATKMACRGSAGRWFGRGTSINNKVSFLVYENGKVIERHVVER